MTKSIYRIQRAKGIVLEQPNKPLGANVRPQHLAEVYLKSKLGRFLVRLAGTCNRGTVRRFDEEGNEYRFGFDCAPPYTRESLNDIVLQIKNDYKLFRKETTSNANL